MVVVMVDGGLPPPLLVGLDFVAVTGFFRVGLMGASRGFVAPPFLCVLLSPPLALVLPPAWALSRGEGDSWTLLLLQLLCLLLRLALRLWSSSLAASEVEGKEEETKSITSCVWLCWCCGEE